MMKKRVVALTTAAVMALSMTACGGGGGADKTASGDKEGGLSGEITVWSWDVAWHWRILRNGQRSSRKRTRM